MSTDPVKLTRRSAVTLAGAAAFAPLRANATTDWLGDIDASVARGLSLYGAPGLSLAVVRSGHEPIIRGYGARSVGRPGAVQVDTVLPIASLTKAFTSAAVAMLVSDGKLDWDDKVAARLGDFQMYDPVATREMTVRDLLVHRSGLGLGEGDLMLFPRTDFTRQEVVRKLRYLKPASEFRSGSAYDNVLYLVAGELIGAVSGQPWESFVQDRILGPVGMSDGASCERLLSNNASRATLHARISGIVRGVGPVTALPPEPPADLSNPAGGVFASARDMAKWIAVQLAKGALPDGRRLWSEQAGAAMWNPLTVVDANVDGAGPDTDPHFVLGAPGWVILDYRGTPVTMHVGALPGLTTRIMLVPSKSLGLYIGLNSEEETLHESMAYTILDAALGLPTRDYLREGAAQDEARRQRRLKRAATQTLVRPQPIVAPGRALADYAGRYRSDWYGDIVVTLGRSGLAIDFTRTPAMRGPLLPWTGETFLTRFPDHNIEDALATFTAEPSGPIVGLRLKAASASADFSFDYQDLALLRIG